MNFSIAELCITNQPITQDIADKILKYHIVPMQKVRDIIGIPIYASQQSGYRPYDYEISNGRSGKSQHTFQGKGAVDWTCDKWLSMKDIFIMLLIDHTDYTRICVYNNFIHCDYKGEIRQLFESDSMSNWKLKQIL